MANYKETTNTGTITTWLRTRQMILDNPIDASPSAMCYVSEATRYPDNSVKETTSSSVNYTLTDPTAEIPIIDPTTFEPTEQTFTTGQFWLQAASVALWLMRQQEVPQLPPE